MSENNKNQIKFDTIDIFLFLYRKKMPIIIITVIGAIASIIVSLIITPKFKSTVVLFPASQSSLSKSLLTNNPYKDDILKFGEEEDAERLIQVLYSDDIRDYIIEKYDLFTHYDIDMTSGYPLTAIYKEYDNNITFKKTEYQSIEIKVLDKNPEIAANIANDIAALIDTVINNMMKERAVEAYKIVSEQYSYLENYIQALEDSLAYIRGLGVLDYSSEVDRYSQQYAYGLATNSLSKSDVNQFEEKFDLLQEYGGQYMLLKEQIFNQKAIMVEMHQKLLEAKLNAESTIPNKFVVNTALPAEKKSYPVRWLIVTISTLGAFLFAIFMVITLDFVKELKTRIQNAPKETV